MSKKNGNNRNKPAAKSAVRSAVRNTSIPKSISRPPQYAASSQQQRPGRQITYEMIAKRAYEISQSPQCGSEMDNWLRAERELKASAR
jgi:hypothetical protein